MKKIGLILTVIFILLGLICTSFKQLSVIALTNSNTNIQNGGFEDKKLDEIPTTRGVKETGRYAITTSEYMLNWKTTATDKKIEVGEAIEGFKSPHMETDYRSKTNKNEMCEGMQYAELCGNEKSSLFQNIVTEENKSYIWEIGHRARGETTNGQDVIAVIIGDKQNVDPSKNAEGNDQYMQMINWMKEEIAPTLTQNNISELFEIYSKKFDSNGGFLNENETSNFSITRDSEHTELWKIRLISSGTTKWYKYKQEYVSYSTQTTFVLTPYSIINPRYESTGNLIDAVKFKTIDENELLENGNFDTVEINSQYKMLKAKNSDNPVENIGWSTTANDRNIEIGTFAKGTSVHIGTVQEVRKTKVYTPDGTQFVELNANEVSSLYQNIQIKSGTKYEWSLYHRSRLGIDAMALIIGEKQEYEPMKNGKDSSDQLMRIVEWIKEQPEINIGINLKDFETEACSQKIILYSTPFVANGGYADNDNPFSWERNNKYTEQWNVWIMTSECSQWHGYGNYDSNLNYDNTYNVKEGTTEAIFGFVSYSAQGGDTLGNLIDGIDIEEQYRVECYTTPNGSGTYTYKSDTEITYNKNYIGYIKANDTFDITVDISRQEELGRNFVGARINGEFVKAELFSNNGNGKLIYTSPAVNQHYEIRLIFAAHQIIYDSNRRRYI